MVTKSSEEGMVHGDGSKGNVDIELAVQCPVRLADALDRLVVSFPVMETFVVSLRF